MMEQSGTLLLSAVSVVSVLIGIASGVYTLRHGLRDEIRKSTADMTMVMVKLEDIGMGVSEIKADLSNVKGDIRALTERVIVAEQAVAQGEKRINEINRRLEQERKERKERKENA